MKLTVKEMTKIAIFPALMIATAGISIPMTGAPITLQTLFVLLAGMILGARLGALSMVIYIILGAFGLPVFANFSGGMGVILGPTGGFILAFPIAAFITGLLVKQDNKLSYLIAGLIASVVIYLMGIPWLSYMLGWRLQETLVTMSVYFPGDLIKLVLAIFIADRLSRHNLT
ncbi:biotin transporter BioY [Mycoplasmatota bacterium WC44]